LLSFAPAGHRACNSGVAFDIHNQIELRPAKRAAAPDNLAAPPPDNLVKDAPDDPA
jgi:hypothetical protein